MSAPAVTDALAPTPHFRPAFHFTPQTRWMNDPNGLVFHRGVYHLFFQHHPGSAVWGPMHWGHATSTDLLRWEERPIALAPDALGQIFSGSAVVDHDNRAGFGPPGSSPLVAMFTHHGEATEGDPIPRHEVQSLAFSLDDGLTWAKHTGNPVLPNPGLKDFRDPKLRWLPGRSCWLISLACGDHIRFYSSPDLHGWTLESAFGAGIGAHGGVWECPDLFPLSLPDGRRRWVLLVSLNPGGPQGGSATQYFVGDFDGHRFTPDDHEVRWLDLGPDNYAGVTWAGVEDRALFIGWMSNWNYANTLPTAPWRSTMTMPRELVLREVGGEIRVASQAATEVQRLLQPASFTAQDLALSEAVDLSDGLRGAQGRFMMSLAVSVLRSFELTLANEAGDALRLGYDESEHCWWIDRRHSGLTGFHPAFAGQYRAPRITTDAAATLDLWFDATSVELFADGGLTSMTAQFFPQAPWSRASLASSEGVTLAHLSIQGLRDPR